MHYDFIEIGTADFHTEIEKANPNTRGLSVEPVLYYLNKLPPKPLVHKVLAAISDQDGWADCYYLPESMIDKHFPGQWELKGNNAINTYHPQALHHVQAAGLNPEEIFAHVRVPKFSFQTLADMYQVTSLDLLKTDTEGHDCIILRSVINCIQANKIQIEQIKFESNVLSNAGEVDSVIMSLQKLGYKLLSRGEDTILKNFTCK